jgi:competence protein ComEC
MIIWSQNPFVKILFPFLSGIILAMLFDEHPGGLVTGGWIFCGVATTILLIIQGRVHFKLQWLYGLLTGLLLVFSGYLLTASKIEKNSPGHALHLPVVERQYLFRLTEPVKERENSYRIVARILFCHDSTWLACRGRVMLYVAKDSAAAALQYGDEVLVSCLLRPVAPPQNPHEFNYRRYLAGRNVYQQAYVGENKWELLARGKGNWLLAGAFRLRTRFLELLEEGGLKGDRYAVASAILVGCDDKLDRELLNDYRGTGTLHVLCVSGLHVGVVYIMISSLLFFLQRSRTGRNLRVIIVLAVIWFYALITGLSPPVLRAAIMFSLLHTGSAIGRKTNTYNLLAASAFLILVFDPLAVADVGMQLSYAAVLGIVSLYPVIYPLWKPRFWLLDKIWALIAVSLAAQVATFPLGLYYFHQFPLIFLLSNLVAVPLAGFIIYAGMAVAITLPLKYISVLVLKAFSFLILLLNESVRIMESLPFASLRGATLTSFELFILYAGVIALLFLFIKGRKKHLYWATVSMTVLMLPLTFRNIQHESQARIIIYNIGKSTALEFTGGRDNYVVTDSLLCKDARKVAWHMDNSFYHSGIRHSAWMNANCPSFTSDSFDKYHEFIQFLGMRVALITHDYPVSGRKIDVDILVISGNPKIEMETLPAVFNFKKLVFDSSNPVYRVNRWIKDCRSLGIPYHAVCHSGAFVEEIDP